MTATEGRICSTLILAGLLLAIAGLFTAPVLPVSLPHLAGVIIGVVLIAAGATLATQP